ncbi:MAG: barstar family protein [Planctomycetes bacterium]|nr:barstar family protein [Planctomycetota bacterium]
MVTAKDIKAGKVKQTIILDLGGVGSEEAFHDAFQKAMGFPDNHGKDMNGWITCMALLAAPNSKISSTININPGEAIAINVIDSDSFMNEHPELFCSFVESVAFANQRHLADGISPAIHLVFC